ncbi:VCBS repeat-containing protein [Sulfitobacter sp. S190]|uniref:FG-GAP repeat domain-containing protein n=1 Tax=Sulfitobacter sp. S190 TaxID=2867022 RepID=UPI0021A49CCE|nr:VCBS repeat-containing protein [Sulfitobacter sp. S190]UWR21420.1 VCBS repeat-containing protein [Sulfitobacter sp. S190]
MFRRARRLAERVLARHLRRALPMLCLGLAGAMPSATAAQDPQPWVSSGVEWARFAAPTARYPHGVLGDEIEYGALEIKYDGDARVFTLTLPTARVFEDTTPRVVDVDGDGLAEVVVVESDRDQGARLAIYNGAGLLAATPFIGQRFRWLAPVAIADLDGDGAVELAYIDRPHLAKTLRIWRYANDGLIEVASQEGLTNHRIGERDIAGGLRNCADGPEMIVARADWRRVMSVRFDGTGLITTELGPHTGRDSFAKAMAC